MARKPSLSIFPEGETTICADVGEDFEIAVRARHTPGMSSARGAGVQFEVIDGPLRINAEFSLRHNPLKVTSQVDVCLRFLSGESLTCAELLHYPNKEGRRPAQGNHSRWNDEHWRDHALFYEYFHGDTGAGIGASHQTGWTGVIAFLIQGFTAVQAEKFLEKGMTAVAEVSAEVAKETDKPEAVEVAEEVHEEVAEKVVAQVLETVQHQVAEAVQHQGAEAEELQEKVKEIVMEKVAEAVQKKAEEVQKQTELPTEEKKDVL